jgi:hypothetical protein
MDRLDEVSVLHGHFLPISPFSSSIFDLVMTNDLPL